MNEDMIFLIPVAAAGLGAVLDKRNRWRGGIVGVLLGGVVSKVIFQSQAGVTSITDHDDQYKSQGDGGPEHVDAWNPEMGYNHLSVDYPTFTGGTFLHPEYLPPLRTVEIEGIGAMGRR